MIQVDQELQPCAHQRLLTCRSLLFRRHSVHQQIGVLPSLPGVPDTSKVPENPRHIYVSTLLQGRLDSRLIQKLFRTGRI